MNKVMSYIYEGFECSAVMWFSISAAAFICSFIGSSSQVYKQ